jgi:membrane-associated protein
MSGWLERLIDPAAVTAAGVYLAVFVMVFLESGVVIGFLLPGDVLLFGVGLLTARPGSGVSLPVTAGGVLAAAVAGDVLGYWTGERFGRPWLLRRTHGGTRHLDRAERFYRRWGALAVVAARFIPWARTFVPLLAGVSRMPYRRFLLANVGGALAWGPGLVTVGHLAAGQPGLRRAAYLAVAAGIGMSVLGSLTAGLRRVLRARGRRARGAGRAEPDPGSRS